MEGEDILAIFLFRWYCYGGRHVKVCDYLFMGSSFVKLEAGKVTHSSQTLYIQSIWSSKPEHQVTAFYWVTVRETV